MMTWPDRVGREVLSGLGRVVGWALDSHDRHGDGFTTC
jgi:hypothetical protein